jgi:hypothetical protein
VPPAGQAEHKIQSGAGGLTLALRPTPKRLGDVKGAWCPAALAVSFKLETDPALLMPKAAAAVARRPPHPPPHPPPRHPLPHLPRPLSACAARASRRRP